MEGNNNNNNNNKKKQGVKSGSSSSFTAELFGVNDASTDQQSTGIFASIFPPPSKVVGRNSTDLGCWQKNAPGNQAWAINKHGSSAIIGGEGSRYNKDRNSVTQEQRVEPCHLSSSLYYGGQEVYSRSPTNHTSTPYPTFKKDSGEDDPNGSNLTDASRGNWWQGSLYY